MNSYERSNSSTVRGGVLVRQKRDCQRAWRSDGLFIRNSPPYEGGVDAASADGVVLYQGYDPTSSSNDDRAINGNTRTRLSPDNSRATTESQMMIDTARNFDRQPLSFVETDTIESASTFAAIRNRRANVRKSSHAETIATMSLEDGLV